VRNKGRFFTRAPTDAPDDQNDPDTLGIFHSGGERSKPKQGPEYGDNFGKLSRRRSAFVDG